jgi:hypothetical protein
MQFHRVGGLARGRHCLPRHVIAYHHLTRQTRVPHVSGDRARRMTPATSRDAIRLKKRGIKMH